MDIHVEGDEFAEDSKQALTLKFFYNYFMVNLRFSFTSLNRCTKNKGKGD